MKITCQACQSKYTIADDKVLGKVVKIRCKKCGATIFVNGSDGSTTTGSDADHEPLSRYRAEGPAEGWTVNVAEGDQRTMTDEQVVAAFRAGSLSGETFLWKDGMPDWVPLRETGELFLTCTGAATASPGTAKVAASQHRSAELLGAPAQNARQDAGAPGGSNGSGGAFPGAAAARRAGGRGAGVDLFGGVAQAGGEADVITSAPAKIPQPHEGPQKPTGARNESSVLFSLSAMTAKASSDPPPRVSGEEASGLIDIRQLSAQIGIEDKKQSRVDDIMNLTGGGAFSPTLMAPTLSAPAFDAYAPDSVAGGGLAPAQSRNKGVILLAVGAGACVLVAAIGGAYAWMHGKQSTDAETPSASASSVEVAVAPSASAAPAGTTTGTPSASASAPAAASAAPSPEATGKPAAAETKTAANAPASKEPTSAPAPRAAGAPAVEAGPFNMGEAKARLGAAAAAAAGCKRANGPTGTGRVVVLFGPSGGTQSATVSGPPFEGTPTGACVAARFRAVRVPAFSGSPFSVSKSFTIN
jgi:predicted Zn finger-like uncharacterized protein